VFGIGFGELILILIVTVLAIGPDKLPSLIKTVAKMLAEFRRAKADLQYAVFNAEDEADFRDMMKPRIEEKKHDG